MRSLKEWDWIRRNISSLFIHVLSKYQSEMALQEYYRNIAGTSVEYLKRILKVPIISWRK